MPTCSLANPTASPMTAGSCTSRACVRPARFSAQILSRLSDRRSYAADRGSLPARLLPAGNPERPSCILLPSGTGFAPIKSIIEICDPCRQLSRPMHLYWGARSGEDIYLAESAEPAGRSAYAWFSASRRFCRSPHSSWTGRTGLVHEAVREDYGDLSVCGRLCLRQSADGEHHAA